jgi:nucleoside-diphosphate-sugar epimerase
MAILVAGGKGLIGSNVARALVDLGREVIIHR